MLYEVITGAVDAPLGHDHLAQVLAEQGEAALHVGAEERLLAPHRHQGVQPEHREEGQPGRQGERITEKPKTDFSEFSVPS